MDISVASNFERLLYNLYDDDSSLLAKNMRSFPERSIDIPEDKKEIVSSFFKSFKSNDQEILAQINETHSKTGYILDPHTATGVRASDVISIDNPVITMGTAHPAKFTDAIEKAIPDYKSPIPAKVEMAFMQEEQFSILADNYDEIKKFILTNAL
jgi:threonine synthase